MTNVIQATGLYDTEGYDSMSLDRFRNLFFLKSIIQACSVNNCRSFIEFGTGAHAKLTKMILDIHRHIGNCDAHVITYEVNPASARSAHRLLASYGARVKLVLGDIVDMQTMDVAHDCLIGEVIGCIASCEGQCRILSRLRDCQVRCYIPGRFGTYACAYTGVTPALSCPHRCRGRTFARIYGNKHVQQTSQLTIEEWTARDVHLYGCHNEPFVSEIVVRDASAIVSFIVLDQSTDCLTCSSAPWTERRARAENWDVFVFPLTQRVTGRLRMRSLVNAVSVDPSYRIQCFDGDDECVLDVCLNLNTILSTPRL